MGKWVAPTRMPRRIVTIKIGRYDDSAYTHACGALVAKLALCQRPLLCPRCGRTT